VIFQSGDGSDVFLVEIPFDFLAFIVEANFGLYGAPALIVVLRGLNDAESIHVEANVLEFTHLEETLEVAESHIVVVGVFVGLELLLGLTLVDFELILGFDVDFHLFGDCLDFGLEVLSGQDVFGVLLVLLPKFFAETLAIQGPAVLLGEFVHLAQHDLLFGAHRQDLEFFLLLHGDVEVLQAVVTLLVHGFLHFVQVGFEPVEEVRKVVLPLRVVFHAVELVFHFSLLLRVPLVAFIHRRLLVERI